jgi:predicted RNase H-like nuclease (RuvC/YqgF family)
MSDQRVSQSYREIAELKRRISKLEYADQELDNVVSPSAWIGEAFERVDEDIEEVKKEVKESNQKLDIILQHITGINRD